MGTGHAGLAALKGGILDLSTVVLEKVEKVKRSRQLMKRRHERERKGDKNPSRRETQAACRQPLLCE